MNLLHLAVPINTDIVYTESNEKSAYLSYPCVDESNQRYPNEESNKFVRILLELVVDRAGVENGTDQVSLRS